jgi:tetratricopeptide (TPR) repeat protein
MRDEAESFFIDPTKYREAFLRVCELDPNEYLDLGKYLVKNDRKAEAVEAFQKAVDLAPNRVGVANGVDWLVNYYYDQGESKKALEVADMAADVYSYRGLETKAKLMEKMKNYPEAERIYLAIDERYDDKKVVFNFYQRAFRATNDAEYQRKLDAMKK